MTVDDLMALADAYAHNTADELWQNRMRDDGVPVDCYARENRNALFAALESALEEARNIVATKISLTTDTMEQEIATHVRRAVVAERERCAKVCESEASIWEADNQGPAIEARLCAARIRSMGAAAIRKGEAP